MVPGLEEWHGKKWVIFYSRYGYAFFCVVRNQHGCSQIDGIEMGRITDHSISNETPDQAVSALIDDCLRVHMNDIIQRYSDAMCQFVGLILIGRRCVCSLVGVAQVGN